MNSSWTFSRTFRDAKRLRRRVRKLCRTHYDLLPPEGAMVLDSARVNLDDALRSGAEEAMLQARMKELDAAAHQWLQPHRYETWQENMEVILVALAVAMAIRTFFLQPFQIPTGSMQPTLYGIEQGKVNDIPPLPKRFWDACVHGVSYRENIFRFNVQIAGDHLLVDRLTYNFRAPRRGEIIVFETKGIHHREMIQDQFYIKRLVGLSGERISIGDDQRLRIDGVSLTSTTPHFERIYSFSNIPRDSHYFGHVNERVARSVHRPGLAPLFPDEQTVREIPPGNYMAMGDNTLNSSDSRTWGTLPGKNLVGKSAFVYWPFSNHGESRFGWGYNH
ncbi:MAG: signal peptidase I [Verrucomicrobiota bacterium]